MMNCYKVLKIDPSAEFSALRRAYRTKAMACHPDRFGGDSSKTEEFKRLVEAFNILTDPVQRSAHDLKIGLGDGRLSSSLAFDMGSTPEDASAILDTLADDILEELIVGNHLNVNDTTLATLMLDLEQTEQFCLFREAKTLLYKGAAGAAGELFRKYLGKSPGNILAHYFLSKCCKANGNWRSAKRELLTAIRIGERRVPPLKLIRIRGELTTLRRSRPGFIGALNRLFMESVPDRNSLPADEAERLALQRAINRLARDEQHQQKRVSHRIP